MESRHEEANSFRSEIVLRLFRCSGDAVGWIRTELDATSFFFFFLEEDEVVLKAPRLNSKCFGD